MEIAVEKDDRGAAEGHFYKKKKPPADRARDQPAEEGTADAGDAPDTARDSLDLRPLLDREEVANDGQRDGLYRTGAQSLDRAKEDQLPHAAGQAAQDGPNEEHHAAKHQDWLAPVNVGELAVDRHRHRRGEQIDREDPAQERDTAKAADNRRDRRDDDGRVERRQRD